MQIGEGIGGDVTANVPLKRNQKRPWRHRIIN